MLSDHGDRVLLLKLELPDRDHGFWLTPGGGIEPGEGPEEALIREVREETGREIDGHEGLVWFRRHHFTFQGSDYDQAESFYLVRTPHFTPVQHQNPADHERELINGFRWWSAEEMAVSSDVFVPREFAGFLKKLLLEGAPAAPIDVGV
jgi:8-oxo-dGTP pyrophosphatase MutT (NUDIX family)